jgi:hypothetical protein
MWSNLISDEEEEENNHHVGWLSRLHLFFSKGNWQIADVVLLEYLNVVHYGLLC